MTDGNPSNLTRQIFRLAAVRVGEPVFDRDLNPNEHRYDDYARRRQPQRDPLVSETDHRPHVARHQDATQHGGTLENDPVIRLPQPDVVDADRVKLCEPPPHRVEDVGVEVLVRQEREHPLGSTFAAHLASNSAFDGPFPNFASISARNSSASASHLARYSSSDFLCRR